MAKPGPKPGTPVSEAARKHQWRKGNSGNPGGITKEMARRIRTNAEKATLLREKFLDATESRIATIEVMAMKEFDGDVEKAVPVITERTMALLSGDVNRLLTDSENRGFGAPKQRLDVDDKRERDPEDMTDAELEAIVRGEEPEEDEQG